MGSDEENPSVVGHTTTDPRPRGASLAVRNHGDVQNMQRGQLLLFVDADRLIIQTCNDMYIQLPSLCESMVSYDCLPLVNRGRERLFRRLLGRRGSLFGSPEKKIVLMCVLCNLCVFIYACYRHVLSYNIYIYVYHHPLAVLDPPGGSKL